VRFGEEEARNDGVLFFSGGRGGEGRGGEGRGRGRGRERERGEDEARKEARGRIILYNTHKSIIATFPPGNRRVMENRLFNRVLMLYYTHMSNPPTKNANRQLP